MIHLDQRHSPLQHQLIQILNEHGPLSRKQLQQLLDYPRTTIYDNLMQLKEAGYVEKRSQHTNTRGRPIVFFYLKEET